MSTPAIHPATGEPVLRDGVLDRMAADVAREEAQRSRHILVRFDRVYGNVVCYPVDDAAKVVAKLAGTKTLRPRDLQLIRQLGFAVHLQAGNLAFLEAFVAGEVA